MALQPDEVLELWLECSGTTLTPSHAEIFLNRPEVRELANYPKRVLRGAATALMAQSGELRLKAWLDRLKYPVLPEASDGRTPRVRQPQPRGRWDHHGGSPAPVQRELHRRIGPTQKYGDAT